MDPLRPFTDLIRSLTRPSASQGRTRASGGHAQSAAAGAQGAPLDMRLRARREQLLAASPGRMRELFTETVLASELGEELARDPAFSDLVARVAAQLGEDARIAARLEDVLREIIRT